MGKNGVRKLFKKRWMKFTAVGLAVLVVAGGGFGIYHVIAASGSANSTTTFRKTAAYKGDVKITVSGSGTVSDSSQVTVTSTNAGTIDSVSVKQGDTVTKGQVIAHVTDTTSAQTVLQKQSSLASAQNDLEQAQASLDNLSITSPAAGKVKSVSVSAGDTLSSSKTTSSLALISTARSMSVAVSAPLQDVTTGQTVKVYYNGTALTGTVSASAGSAGDSTQSGSAKTSSGGVTVVIGTDDPAVGSSVTVTTGDGKTIGTGTLALTSYETVDGSGSSGKISKVYVSENTMVSKNQTLFKLDGSTVESEIALKKLAVTSAQNDLTTAQENAAKDTITAPTDGVIAELDIKTGDTVTAGGTVATMIDPNSMETVLSVDELDISKVSVGQQATVTLDAVSGKTFSGSVTQIDPIGSSSNGVTTYNVTVSIDSPSGIKVGMTTNADIVTQSKSNVIVLPASALVLKEGTTGYVLDPSKLFDSSGNSIQFSDVTTRQLIQKFGKQVTIGLSNSDTVQIVSGLSEGDQVAVPVTVNKSMIKSLSNTTSTSTSFFSMGGMGGGEMGGYSTRRSTQRTGNTVSSATNNTTTTTTSKSTTTGGSTQQSGGTQQGGQGGNG
jgi:HlyD family secretion protein